MKIRVATFVPVGSLLLLNLLWGAPDVHAWEAVAHYVIGIEAGADANGRFQNLPDSWPSHNGFTGLWGITEWFAWSHSVQLTGRTNMVPNQPVDASNKWSAGRAMYEIYTRGVVTGPAVFETALGFLTHNAQDRVVHYRYFRGGSSTNWTEEHRDKEQWADCVIYMLRAKKHNGTDGFDHEGKPDPSLLPAIQNDGNADLIVQAQAEFVKSGLSIEEGSPASIHVETVDAVRQRMRKVEAELTKYVQRFRRSSCLRLWKLGKRYNWNVDAVDGLREYFDKAVQATQDVAKQFPR